ncbi:hypothetical protein HPB52_024511 [Rhipicephalus sanguineus]|uniref:Uncharacterized protein n=1 Tax=Rhipicephalus sanguineus TaxID=34632 RepID=A0A9D4TCC2_RHISA|nr:hypothetical protein HPB52_024511 [Rhipicephalus sanguineus]
MKRKTIVQEVAPSKYWPPLSFPSSAEREPSRPPSYRSRTSSAAGGGILRSCVGGNASCSQDTLATVSPAEDEDQRPLHSRNPSLTLSTLSQEEASAAAGPTTASQPAADTVRRSYNASVLGTRGSQSKVPVKQQKIRNVLERDPESSCEV